MSAGIVELNVANFQTNIAKGVILVDFWAPWCGPCRMQTPVLEQMAPKLAGKAVIGKINVDECPQLAGQFSVQSIPTLLIFKNGEVVQQMVGYQTEAKLMAAIESATK